MIWIERKEIERLKKLNLPKWDQIPNKVLYKLELLKCLRPILSPLFINRENFISSSMVNNYVKNGNIKEPVNKKYYRESIAQLLAIIIFKKTLSIDEISKGIEIELKSFAISELYDNFVEIFLDSKEKVLGDYKDLVKLEFKTKNHHDKLLYFWLYHYLQNFIQL